MVLTEGVTLADRYVLEHPLGRGGMGEVWAARHARTGRRVALKVLHAEARSAHRERLIREARAAGSLEHPNVGEVLDVLEHDGSPVLVMPLLRGETLADRLARDRRLPAPEAAAILARVASGVGAAHAAGVVHRDLKPANIFLTDGGGVKVLDFGIAKLDAGDGADKLTATGSLLGTPLYMSPEQALGEKDVDHRSDVWSLGIVLYECLSGVVPTQADNVGQTIKKVLFERMRPIGELAPDTPPALASLVAHMLERRRGKRVADMRAVVTALSALGGVDCALPPSPATTAGVPTPGSTDDATLDLSRESEDPSAAHDTRDTRALAPTEAAPRRSRSARWWAALALLGVATTGSLAWRATPLRGTREASSPTPEAPRLPADLPTAAGAALVPSAASPVDRPGTSAGLDAAATATSSAAAAPPARSPVVTTSARMVSTPTSRGAASTERPVATASTSGPSSADAAKREALRDRR